MKPKLDLISMLLVSVNGRSPVPDIKKRKAKEGFAGEIMSSQNKLLTILSINFFVSFTCVPFPFL